VLIRRELLKAFNIVCNELKLTQQECFLMLLKLFAIVGSSFSGGGVKEIPNNSREGLRSRLTSTEYMYLVKT